MANPQKENGYTQIANEILEHLCHFGINGSEYRILLFVIRKTYGFHKKKDLISLSQFQKGTLMKRANAVRTIKSLVAKRILLKEKGGYIFNKNWEQWIVAKRILGVAKRITPSSQKDTKSSSQKDTYKRKKETNTKDIAETSSAFSIEGEIKKLYDSPRRDLNLIGWYFEKRKTDIQNKAQLQSAIKRHLRAAKQLSPFTDKQLGNAYRYVSEEYPEWTLDTCLKYLTK